ncbi:MAG: ABC transporter ATP-binding protein [Planctomycetaceae bacterium]|nr:ABC transporter ATP-binding protein [Planctomycetaceae bacterium]
MLEPVVLNSEGIGQVFAEGVQSTTVFSDVSLRVRRGEFCLLMGVSGSGKSTLLAILSGLLRPTSGQVSVLGSDLWRLTEPEREEFRRKHFGFVFQGHNLFPALTAREQLEIVLRWGEGMPAAVARTRSDQVLAALGLAHRADRRPTELSGGEKQRVAIGRALVKRPAFCFADEPTRALDSKNADLVVRLFRETARRLRSTVLVITHDERMIPHVDRVFAIRDGRLHEWSRTAPAPAALRVRSCVDRSPLAPQVDQPCSEST